MERVERVPRAQARYVDLPRGIRAEDKISVETQGIEVIALIGTGEAREIQAVNHTVEVSVWSGIGAPIHGCSGRAAIAKRMVAVGVNQMSAGLSLKLALYRSHNAGQRAWTMDIS